MRLIMMTIAASLLLGATTSTTEVTRIGKSCQVCIETGSIRACKHYAKCPIPEKKSEE